MPRMLEKKELLESVVDASRQDRFWFDTIRPSESRAVVSFPESLLGRDVQIVYIPVLKTPGKKNAKDRLHALMKRTPRQLGEPYSFRRADAYEEELA